MSTQHDIPGTNGELFTVDSPDGGLVVVQPRPFALQLTTADAPDAEFTSQHTKIGKLYLDDALDLAADSDESRRLRRWLFGAIRIMPALGEQVLVIRRDRSGPGFLEHFIKSVFARTMTTWPLEFRTGARPLIVVDGIERYRAEVARFTKQETVTNPVYSGPQYQSVLAFANSDAEYPGWLTVTDQLRQPGDETIAPEVVSAIRQLLGDGDR